MQQLNVKKINNEEIKVLEVLIEKAHADVQFRKKCLTDPKGSLGAVANRPYLLDKEIYFIELGTLVFSLSDHLQKAELENAIGGGTSTATTVIGAGMLIYTAATFFGKSQQSK